MADRESELAGRICRRFEQLKSDRGTWEDHWQDIADLVLPNRDFTRDKNSPGSTRRQYIFDSTAPTSADRLAGSLGGLLINPALVWFMLRTADDEINEKDRVRAWLQEVSFRLLWLFNTPRFGFYTSMHEALLDLVTFGTSVIRNENSSSTLSYESMPLGCNFIDEDNEGRVDTLYREFEFNAMQAAQEFGLSNLPDGIQRKHQDGKFDEKFTFVQAVMPRRERDVMKVTGRNKAYASIVVAISEKKLVHEGGFNEFPFIVSRWSKMVGEKYGRSPAMSTLPEIKMVNAMSRTLIVAAEKQADPPLMVPDDGFLSPFSTIPGGLNYYRAGTKELARPLDNNARVDIGHEMIEQRRETIRRAFYLDMFELPIIDRMTATEVQQRQREKQQTLNPVLSRLHAELLTPIINRAFNALIKANAVPPVPQELAGRDLTVEFQSPLALAQRASESAGFTQWLALMAPLLETDPLALSNIDNDEVAHWAKGMFNVPQRIFRSRQEVNEAREAHRQQQEAQQQIAMAEQGSVALKNAGAASESLETLDALAG